MLGARPTERRRALPRRGPCRVVLTLGHRLLQAAQRGAQVADHTKRHRIGASDLARVVVHLHDGLGGAEWRARRVEEPREDARSGDERGVEPLERLGGCGSRRVEAAAPERMIAGKRQPSVNWLAVHGGAQRLGKRHQLGLRARPGDAVAGDDRGRAGSGQQRRRPRDRLRLGRRPHGDEPRHAARVVTSLGHQIHGQREEHGAGRRRERQVDRAAERVRRLGRVAQLVRPLGQAFRHFHHVAGQNRRVEQQPRVLLAGGDQQRTLRPRGVVNDRQGIGEPGRDVEVDHAEPSRRLGIPVGGGARRRLLQRDDIREAGAVERVEEGQLRRAGIAEEVVDVGSAKDLDEPRGDLHQRGGRGVSMGRPCGRYLASMKRRISPGVLPSPVSRITSRVTSVHNVQVAAWLVYVTLVSVSPLM
jgi:hypothetical protein